jgi:ubiquinone/menaquinone biosynthesis C-methylase UbiE
MRALRRTALLNEREVAKFYDAMAPAYDDIAGYHDPEGERLREPIMAHHRQLFQGHRVLEIACGTGYWTEVLGEVAASVLATDINKSVLELARERCRHLPNVTFRAADAYSLDGVSGEFDAAFANCWWSHMPRSRIGQFLCALHSKLKSGSVVLFVDLLPTRSGLSAKNTKGLKFADGNRLELRLAPDGKAYEIIKNYPTKHEIGELLADRATELVYREELGVWSVIYKVI